MEIYKYAGIILYISSVFYYIHAAIDLIWYKNSSNGVVYLCAGSFMLCLGSVLVNKRIMTMITNKIQEKIKMINKKEGKL